MNYTPPFTCNHTGRTFESDESLTDIGEDRLICTSCIDAYMRCEGCGNWTSWGSDDDLCRRCYRYQEERQIAIHSWDYRPPLVFHPTVPVDPKKPMYIGMELEVSFGTDRTPHWIDYLKDWIEPLNKDWKGNDLIYIKGDSSVRNGCEIVTHPMQPRWALRHFPFDAFDKLVTEGGARNSHSSAGTHIHINKEAFTTAHLWKFMQIHFRLPTLLRQLGGRGDVTYASFKDRDMASQRKALLEIAKAKGKPQSVYNRYVAVNLRNEYTIELRYPAGGIKSDHIKKNIQLALALYEYSDYLTVQDIKEGALKEKGADLLQWIQEGEYPELWQWVLDKGLVDSNGRVWV
jgi:hypothetical protein